MVKREWPRLSEFRDHAVSGVILPRLPGQDVKEQAIVRNAEQLGLSNLSAPRRTSLFTFPQGWSRASQVLPKMFDSNAVRNVGLQSERKQRRRPRLAVVVGQRLSRWFLVRLKWFTRGNVLALASFLDSVYVLLSTPLRVGFFFDPYQDGRDQWYTGLVMFTIADVAASVLRIWSSREELIEGTRRLLSRETSKSELFPPLPLQQKQQDELGTFNESPQHPKGSSDKRSSRSASLFTWTISASYCIPWEILFLVAFSGRHLNLLHIFGLFRLVSARGRVGGQLAVTAGGIPQNLTSGTVANITILFLYGMYFCHFAAAGYMLIAHVECGLEFTKCATHSMASPDCWVLRDHLENGSHLRQYVRTLYWACKTVVTLGQGDLIPVTLAETGYRVFVQFFAGLWVTAILTAYTFYFTHKDANLTSNISTRLAQALQFLEARNAPSALVASVDTYFQYMQQTRNGVEEQLILAALPPHYRTQCSHYVRYKSLGQLTMFKRRKGAFLRTVMGALVRDVYAPGQVLLQPGETDEMFIVASGEVRLIDVREAVIGRIMAGDAYAEYALFERHVARSRLEAATFCEVWYLPTKSFKAALAKHFSKLVYASLLLQQFGTKTTSSTTVDDRTNTIKNESEARVDSVTSMKKQARHSKVFGHGSLLLQAIEARKLRTAAAAISAAASVAASERSLSSTLVLMSTVPAWRMPGSKFRRDWALAECILMLYLLAEVPYHIAFQRSFGLSNGFARATSDETTPSDFQIAIFLAALIVEMFFYADLWLRARYFVRPYPVVENNCEFLSAAARTGDVHASIGHVDTPRSVLAMRSPQIFQLYLQHESLVLEIFALVPAALIWDVLPKELFSRRYVYILRGLRLFRLFRVRKLRGKMHEVLARRGYGPAFRLLADVVVFCTAMAHAAACIFFAVADRTSFEGGLPVSGVAPNSVSLPECLDNASRFDNCTWYMYDRSSFDIDAPYLRSMLWSIVVLSTVGFGDIVAFSTRECLVDALWIFFGANICYITSCALSSVLAQLNVLSTIRGDRAEGINVLLMCRSMTSVSDATKRTVRSYYEAKWKLNGSAVGDLELLDHLPRSLRRAVTTQLYEADLRHCTLFIAGSGLRGSGLNSDAALFMQQLTLVVTCDHFLRNVTVTREGHLATEFFVILSGEVECLLPPVPMEIEIQSKVASAARRTRNSIHVAATAALARKFTASSFNGSHSPSKMQNTVQEMGSHTQPLQLQPSEEEECFSTPNDPHVERLLVESLGARRPRLVRYGSLKLVVDALRDGAGAKAAPVPICILKQHDFFGQESLSDITKVYEVSIRVVSSARVAIIRRRDFLILASRFPHYVSRLRAREKELRESTERLVAAHRNNFQGRSNKKLVRVLGTCTSLYVDSSKSKLEKRGAHVLDPTSTFGRWWHRGVGAILVYNFYVIIFRLAFLPFPDADMLAWLTGIDYILDVFLFIDLFLKFGHLGYIEFGEVVLDPEAIKDHYRESGHRWQDVLGMLPLYYRGDPFGMTAARLPRLLRCLQIGELLQEVHTEIQERFLRGNAVLLSAFELVKFFLIFISTAHYIGSVYYLLGWGQLKTGLAKTSWVSVDLVLNQNPNDPFSHYMRTMYWCLSAFTVDCFGDILARNFLETCYELFTCVLGWIFIGQVIGRINALMITLDKTQKQRNDRVEDFQQYAKQRALPKHLRLRAMKGLAIKARCQLELELHSTLRDLPASLHAGLAVEMYSALLQPLPEFAGLSLPQLEAIARALALEIYLPGDLICEANRVGTRLYLLKSGCAERIAPRTGLVYGALSDGSLFGEFAFFLPGAKRLFSVRAVRTCQVLQVHRRIWDRLWPPNVRAQVEQVVLAVVTRKYKDTAWGFLNIAKNFYIKNDSPVPAVRVKQQLSVSPRRSAKAQETGGPTIGPKRIPRHVITSRNIGGGVDGLRLSNTSLAKKMSASDMSSISECVDLESYRSGREAAFDVSTNLDVLEEYCSRDVAVETQKDVVFQTPVEPIGPTATATGISGQQPRRSGLWAKPITATIQPLARLSASTELRWKRHEKRLRAIQLFHVAWGHVQEDLRNVGEPGTTGRITRRRVSICVPPSFTEARDAQRDQAFRQDVGRRHSIQTDPVNMRSKFNLSPSEVRTLEQRMTFLSVDDKTRPSFPTAGILTQNGPPRARAKQGSNSWWKRWLRESSFTSKKISPAISSKSIGEHLSHRSSPYSIWVEEGSRTTWFDPSARFRDVWAAVMLTVTVYYLLFIPLQVGFLDGPLNDAAYETFVMVWFAVEYLLADAACIVDFVLHRRYFVYLTHSGEPVTDPKRIAHHYWNHGCRPTSSWLCASFCDDIKLATAVLSIGGLVNWHTFAFLRINRFLRVVHFHPLSDRLQHFLLYDRHVHGLTPSICYLFRLALDFSMGTHWLSCLFYGISYLAYADGEQSWLTTPGMLSFGDNVQNLAEIRQVPLVQSYLRTYHFSIGAITTVCYGDIIPMNAQETLATMAVIFISVVIFSMLSGGFYKYFDMELGRRAEYEEKVAQVGHFLRFHRFPSDTWRQMQVYFALSWCESRGRRERELLRGLPPSVRQDLAQHVHANLLKNVALFTRCDPKFARAIIAALQHEFFVRNDVIIQRGDMERSLYIVESGIVLISAVRMRNVEAPQGARAEGEADEPPADDDNSLSPSVNEWVAVSVRASVRLKKASKADASKRAPKQRQRSLVALMSPTRTVSDINKTTEREEKIYKGPFDYFGERSLLFGTPRNATCVSLCVTSLFVLTSARFEAILDEFPHERSNSVSAWVMTRTPAQIVTDENA